MTSIIIKRGFVTAGSRLYKAGEVVPVADKATARRMVERSGGDLEILRGDEKNVPEVEVERVPEDVGIPDIDPDAGINIVTKKKK